MKFPSLYDINEMGNKIILSNDYSMENVNLIVNEYFELKEIFR
jgi:adenine-specific DNA-methyltransferase